MIGKDEMGYWLIHRGFLVLAHPNNMRKMVADEIAQCEEPSLNNGPKGQRGFIDVSRPINDEGDGEQGDHLGGEQQDLDLEYFPESPLADGDEAGKVAPFSSRFSFQNDQLPPPEPEEDDGFGYRRSLSDIDEEASESQKRSHKVKSSISKSARRRLRRRSRNMPSHPGCTRA